VSAARSFRSVFLILWIWLGPKDLFRERTIGPCAGFFCVLSSEYETYISSACVRLPSCRVVRRRAKRRAAIFRASGRECRRISARLRFGKRFDRAGVAARDTGGAALQS